MMATYLAVVDDIVVAEGRTVRDVWADVLDRNYGFHRGYITNQDGARTSFADLRDKYGTGGYGACGVEGCEECT